MSALQREAIARVLAQAAKVGVQVPEPVAGALAKATICGTAANLGALLWAQAHPGAEDPDPGCCWGNTLDPEGGCTCWVPVYEVEQAPPRPVTGPDDLATQPAMCGDCAYRKDSPERATAYEEEVLLELPELGTPFWCHEGMRRPAYWQHPDGRRVEGDPANWTPPIIGNIPYRADGSPGLLCHGWATRAVRVRQASSV